MTDDGPLPASDFDAKAFRFWRWNGDGKPPQFTHWTAEGTVIIRGKTPAISSEVLWRPKGGQEMSIGSDDANPHWPARNLHQGNFDKDAGFSISALVPATLQEWNDLGG